MSPSENGQIQDEHLAEKARMLERILDDSDQLVQMSYLEDMTMIYVNGAAKAYRGGDEDCTGKHCYEYMMGLEEQCPFCPLRTQSDQACGHTEIDNGKQVFSVKTMLSEWRGKPAFIEYASDITLNRRAEQAFETQMRTLLRSIPEAQGIMHLDLTEDTCITVDGAATNNLKSVETNVAVDVTVKQTFAYIPNEAKRLEMFTIFNRNALMKAYASGTVEISRDVESYFDDGSVRWARVTARIMQNPGNDHLECLLYGMDISEEVERRKALESRAHKHLALFNALARDYLNVFLISPDNDKVHILKLDGYVTSGFSADETKAHCYSTACERYINERVHPQDKDAMRKAMDIEVVARELAQSPEYVGSYRVMDNGEPHFYQFKYVLAEHDEGILAGFQNIDATIAVEREQQELLKTALDAAEEANRAKSSFLSSMSHDIRTPLNAILGFNDLAKKHLDDPGAVGRYLDKMSISGSHLLDLVNDVLDMSHIESGQMYLAEDCIDLPAVFEDLHTMVAGSAQEAGIELVFDTASIQHARVIGDELKLKKILMNILGNAVKFTGKGGTVVFSAEERSLRTSEYAHFLLRICDNGCGMSREFQQHAFEAFARENDSADGSTSGTGLGLSIVKSLVNAMGGSINLKSTQGVGTEFTISLHLKVAEGNAAPEPIATSEKRGDETLTGKHILLVEDNEFNREIACEILSEAGFTVSTAEDGQVALEKVTNSDSNLFDLILMDIQMPRMNGYEATRAIRELPDPARASLPIIALTANAFSSDRDEALAAGMDGHISKPIDVNTLLAKIRELLN